MYIDRLRNPNSVDAFDLVFPVNPPGAATPTVRYFYHDRENRIAEYDKHATLDSPGDVQQYYVRGSQSIEERAVGRR